MLEINIGNFRDLFLLVVILSSITFGLTILSQIVGFGLVRLSEEIPANVKVEIPPFLDQEDVGGIQNSRKIRYYASLIISNREHLAFTNCYGVLNNVRDTDIKDGSFGFERVNGKRLSWRNNQGNNNCEISIPARTGIETLRVYEIEFFISFEPKATGVSKAYFDICDNVDSIIRIANCLEVKIDFYGKINGKDVKIKPFIGYIKPQYSMEENRVSCQMKIYRGKFSSDSKAKKMNRKREEIRLYASSI